MLFVLQIQTEGCYLQAGDKDALLNALIIAAKKFSYGPPQLLTQICLALSALVLRSVQHKKPIEQLFSSLQTLENQENGNVAVLEMLTVLPEEVIDDQNTDSNISSSLRFQYGQEVILIIDFVVFTNRFLSLYRKIDSILHVLNSYLHILLLFLSSLGINLSKGLVITINFKTGIGKF